MKFFINPFRDLEMFEKNTEIINLQAYNNELRGELGKLDCEHDWLDWQLIYKKGSKTIGHGATGLATAGDITGQFKRCHDCGYTIKQSFN